MKNDPLAKDASRILKTALKKHDYSYKELAKLLGKKGFGDVNDIQLKTKINRGSFSFAFVLRVMRALGETEISVEEPPRKDTSL